MILCSRINCATTECDCGERIAQWALEQAREIERLLVEHTKVAGRRGEAERVRP